MNKEHPRLNLWEKQPFDSDTTDVSRETSAFPQAIFPVPTVVFMESVSAVPHV